MNAIRIYYGEDENQFGDLRIPEGDGPHPIAIVIHGGFWRARVGLDRMSAVAQDLSERGAATWNIEYRRVGQEGGGWPGTLTDAARAADHLYKLAESYPLDLSRIIAVGHSAGGHLALWLAGRHRLPKASVLRTSDSPVSIEGAVSLGGVTDLKVMQEVHTIRDNIFKNVDQPVFDFLGGSPDQVPGRYAEASPIELLPLGVKQILIHGNLDVNVPVGISSLYYQAAQQAGDDIKLVEIPTAEHFKLVDTELEEWQLVAAEIMTLLQK
ncbi:alpha/beta hydrolase family protein [Ferviditalea candida]|uniref:Alpha/beta hydrolase n=1 Tax=Ferviditalea candida TaxID=3108399 RepID=A0ABU5ZDK4_9BACL|nr:alpha/beta hydrolase [Paenibacillaceae bacterium T2]